jgi:hypothetical protein
VAKVFGINNNKNIPTEEKTNVEISFKVLKFLLPS